MALLSRDQILSKRGHRTFEIVPVPELGGEVRVQSLMADERDDFETSCMTGKGKNRDVSTRQLRSKLVALTAVDEAGVPLFSQADVTALGEISAAAIDRIFGVAQKLSGLSDEDVQELTDDLKNDQPAGSPSGSR